MNGDCLFSGDSFCKQIFFYFLFFLGKETKNDTPPPSQDAGYHNAEKGKILFSGITEVAYLTNFLLNLPIV